MKKAKVFKRVDSELLMPWQAEIPGLNLPIRFYTQAKAFEYAYSQMLAYRKAMS